MSDATTTPAGIFRAVRLDQPIARGGGAIEELQLRKPDSGSLRGVKLTEVLEQDVNSLIKVLPRISTPAITEQDVAGMDPADLLACGSEVAGFLLQKATLQAAFLPT